MLIILFINTGRCYFSPSRQEVVSLKSKTQTSEFHGSLAVRHCHSCGSGCCCGTGSIKTFCMSWVWQKNKKPSNLEILICANVLGKKKLDLKSIFKGLKVSKTILLFDKVAFKHSLRTLN